MRVHYYPPILTYHHIDRDQAKSDSNAVSPQVFAWQIEYLHKHRFHVIPLEALAELLRSNKKIPRKTIAVTFDDGYANNLMAVEMLNRYQFSATIFIILDRIGKSNHLHPHQIEWIQKNSRVNFGSHTVSHPYLPDLNKEQLREEFLNSKLLAKDRYGLTLSTLAYPAGGFNKEIREEAIKAKFVAACTTNRGYSNSDRFDLFAIRRIKMTERDTGIRFWAKSSGYYDSFRELKPPS